MILLEGLIWIWHLLIYILQNVVEKPRDYSLLIPGIDFHMLSHLMHVGFGLGVLSKPHEGQAIMHFGGREEKTGGWRFLSSTSNSSGKDVCASAYAISLDYSVPLSPLSTLILLPPKFQTDTLPLSWGFSQSLQTTLLSFLWTSPALRITITQFAFFGFSLF